MFVIDSYIELYEEDTMPYKMYGIYNSKEQAIEELTKIKNHFQDNYANNILSVWNLGDDGFALKFTYIEPGTVAFKQVASLYYEVKEMYTPDSILNVSPNNIGSFIQKIMFPDND